jgi:Condensin complex subunit 2
VRGAFAGRVSSHAHLRCCSPSFLFISLSLLLSLPIISSIHPTRAVDEPDKVGDIQINYARKAKQVDVKALKASIWTELCDELADHPENVEPNRQQKVRASLELSAEE